MYQFSEDDIALLRQLVRSERERRRNPEQRPFYPVNDHQAPEVYVALTPLGGIPALLEPGLGTGTGSGNEANSADCAVYRVLPEDANPTIFALHPVSGLTRTVYNLSESAIAGDSWILAVRDKFGVWWAVPTATGSGGNTFSGARYFLDAVQSIPSNTLTPVVWNLAGQDYDTDDYVTPSTSQILPAKVGYFLITATAVWDNSGSPSGYRQLELLYNSTILDLDVQNVSVATGLSELTQRASTTFFADGGIVSVNVGQGDSGAVNLVGGNGTTVFSSNFSLSFLGP